MMTSRSIPARSAFRASISVFLFILACPAADAGAAPATVSTANAAPAAENKAGKKAEKLAEKILHFKGQVLGPDLAPVPKASLAMIASPKQEDDAEVSIGRMMRGGRRRSPDDEDESAKPVFYTAIADTEGKFDIELPGTGPWNLRVESDNLAPTIVERVRPSSSSSPVYLQPGVSLSGRVYDLKKKTPIEGAKVFARTDLNRGFRDPDDPDRFTPAATTGRDGGFTLKNLTPNFYNLEVTAGGFALQYVPKVAADGARKENLLVYLEPGFSVAGKTVDRDGKGVAGADVSVSGGLPTRFNFSSMAAIGALQARTEKDGRFKLNGLPQTNRLTVIASTKDGARGRLSLGDPGNRASLPDVEVVLDRPAKITGRLKDADDKPVRRASLSVSYSEGSAYSRAQSFHKSEAAMKIGEKGEFTIDQVPAGTGTVEIHADGYKTSNVEKARLEAGGTLDLGAVTLERGRTVKGRVTDAAGKGIAGAEVEASSFSPEGFFNADTKTDSEGRYILGGLEERRITVTASLEGFGEERKEEVAPDSEGIDFVLKKAGSISGRVVFGDPAVPVTNFSANAHPKDTGDAFRGMFRMMIGQGRSFNDAHGRFTLRGLAPGSYTVEISSPGSTTTLRESVTVKEGEPTDIGDVAMQAGASVRGRVVDANSNPIPGAGVKVRPPGMFSRRIDPNEQVVLADLDGRFILKGLPAGSQTIIAEHPDYARAEATTRAEPGTETDEVVLTMSRGGKIAGVVRDSQGTPQSGAGVIAMIPTDPLGSSPVQTDDQGQYAIENLRPGGYIVMKLPASDSGGRVRMMPGSMDTRQAEVKDGQTAVVNFGEEKKIRVYGSVRKAGAAVGGAQVFWMTGGDDGSIPSFQTGKTDEGGAYEVSLTKPGTYSVRVTPEGESMISGVAFSDIKVPDEAEFKKDLIFPEGAVVGSVFAASDHKPIEAATVLATTIQETDKKTETGSTTSAAPARGRGRADRNMAGSTQTKENGSYRLEGLSPGAYRLTVSKEGFADETIDRVVVADSGAATADALLVSGRKVVARVLDADGRPVPQAITSLLDSQGQPIGGMRFGGMTGVDGMTTLTGVKEGSYTLVVITRDLAPGLQRGVDVTPETDGATEIRLSAGGSLLIKLLDTDGKPVEGATASLVDPTGVDLGFLIPGLRMMSGLPASTGSDGTMSFPRLAPGKYVVTATTRSGAAVEGSSEVLEGKSATLTLKLK